MKAWLTELKRFRHLLILMIIVAAFYGAYFYYYFSPITNNAFIVANIRPIAAQVSGNISEIYIKNGANVKTNQALFKIDDRPFKLKTIELTSMINSSKYHLKILEHEIKNHQLQLNVEKNKAATAKEKFIDAKKLLESKAGSRFNYLQFKNSYHQQNSLVQITENNIVIAKVKIQKQQQTINTLKVKLALAKYDLSNTVVYAKGQGVISNMFLSKGAPVIAFKPLFSFIDSKQYWVQANFKETDLGQAKINQKANIVLRMYGSNKVFKGLIVSLNWAVDRQLTNKNSQLPMVENENQWILMPQRFPVLIKILGANKNYPLHVGASAYVTLVE